MKTIVPLCLILLAISVTSSTALEIRGNVKNGAGEALAGASVYIEAMSYGVSCGPNGEYTLANLRPGTYVLVASIIGYRTEKKTVALRVTDKTVTVDFVLDQVATALGEVVVTAEKFDENLQRIPAAVTALDAERITNLALRERTDLSSLAPNTFVAESGSHMTNLINIRGIFPASFFEATSLFYYDGVPIVGYGMNPQYLSDLDRIEILRGPQGTLYGRNALAGVINIVSRRPNNMYHSQCEVSYGSYADRRVSAGVSVPVIPEKLFIRLSGYSSARNGYFTNTLLQKNAGETKGQGGALSLRYFPGDAFSAELMMNMESIQENPWPYAASPDEAFAHPYAIAMDVDNLVDKLNTIGALKLEYRTGFLNISSTSTYQGITRFRWQYDADFSPLDVLAYEDVHPKNQVFTEELRFESTYPSSPWHWVGGLFLSAEASDNQYNAILGRYWTSPRGIPIYPLVSATAGNNSTTCVAEFGQISYTFDNKLTVLAGIRNEMETIDLYATTRYLYHGMPVPLPVPALQAIDTVNQSKDFSFVSPKFSLTYAFDEQHTIYASAARGFRGGGFNSGANKVVPFYEPENTWNYEVGYKTMLFDRRLRAGVTAFWIDWNHQQLLTVGDLSSPLQTISNAGKTISKGLELDLTAVPFQGCTVNLASGLLDATFDEFSFHELKNGKDTVYSYTGNRLPNAPPLTSTLSVAYERPVALAGLSGLFNIDLNWQFVDSYYMSHMNLYKSAPRNLLSGRIALSSKGYSLYFWGKNLLDHRYVYAVYEYRGGTQTLLGAPRTIGLGLSVQY
jgi:iron complex outermembrane recepter protein